MFFFLIQIVHVLLIFPYILHNLFEIWPIFCIILTLTPPPQKKKKKKKNNKKQQNKNNKQTKQKHDSIVLHYFVHKTVGSV